MEPDAIFLVTGEMVVVNLDDEPRANELSSEWLYAERPIDKKYGPIRRLRSGLLLRWH